MISDQTRRLRAAAAALLYRPHWNDEDIDQAIALHDLLLTPDGEPDPTAARLRKQLARDLTQRSNRSGHAMDVIRAQIFAAGWLDSPDPFQRRLLVLQYQGMTSFAAYQMGAAGQLDRAIDVLLDLDRAVRDGGYAARTVLGPQYDLALVNLAGASVVRYQNRRELLLFDQAPDAEREAIEADLKRAIDVSERVLQLPGSPARASAMAALGYCYTLRYEMDEYDGRADPAMIDSAVDLLQQALGLTGTGAGPVEAVNRAGLQDRLAAALLARNRRADVDAAIELLTEVRSQSAFMPEYNASGGALAMATARVRRWLHTRSPADRRSARAAYSDGFAVALDAHPAAAVNIATQWGGWAWSEGWWAEAGEAYGRALQALHLMVRRQASREERQLVLRRAPDVAALAAFGLVRGGAAEAALVALETGRAVLLAETFDRRALDYDRIAALAGPGPAERYRFLTGELARLDTQLLAQGPGNGQLAAELEALRNERFVVTQSLGHDTARSLAELDRPPAFAELREAAAGIPVIHLAATPEGGVALILREGSVEPVELPELTTGAAAELVDALDEAVRKPDRVLADEICEALWLAAMDRVLPALDGAPHAVVIPGGRLSVLPWHAARIPGPRPEYVLDRLALSYLPNIRSLPRARAAAQDLTSPLRVLAVGQPMPTKTPVLATDVEIAAVCSHESDRFRVTRLPPDEATAAAVRVALSRFQVIHFAGHAAAVPDNPLASAMSMANDEPLTVRDLLTSDIGAARFAVLSACETARAEDPLSEEAVNFPTALLQCGLGGVVGSLWPSYDRASALLMERFYQEWQERQLPPAEALRAAQQWTKGHHRYASPLFWASFVCVGP